MTINKLNERTIDWQRTVLNNEYAQVTNKCIWNINAVRKTFGLLKWFLQSIIVDWWNLKFDFDLESRHI